MKVKFILFLILAFLTIPAFAENTESRDLYWSRHYSEPLVKNVTYTAFSSVLQIFNNGFLADISRGNDTRMERFTIFIEANDANKLMAGDTFQPPLNLKFTGRYYNYKNFYGETMSVPIFYIEYMELINVCNPRRANINMGYPFMRFR